MNFTVDQARKVLQVVDAGLSRGLGSPEPGKMCVEAAICYALGLPHGDDPGCVSSAVRSFKISLNDKRWSSNEARAKGLRALAIAQLGSKGVISDREFVSRLTEETIRQIVPIALRAAATRVPRYAEALKDAAQECVREGTRASALKAKTAADAAANAAANPAASAAANVAHAAYAAANAAYAAANAAADVANAASAAAYAANAAAYAGAAAAYADAADADALDSILAKVASIALDILREMGAPGVTLWDEMNA